MFKHLQTLFIDEVKLRYLQEQTEKLILIGTILLVTVSTVGSSLQGNANFKQSLKDHLTILFSTIDNVDKYGNYSTDFFVVIFLLLFFFCCRNIENELANIAEQVVQDVKTSVNQHNLKPFTVDVELLLRRQILDVNKPDNRIRSLIRKNYLIFHNIHKYNI